MTTHPGRLDGKVAIITGAGSGIGLATARLFAHHGARVVVADIDDQRGKICAEEIGGRYVHCDVSDAGDITRLYDSVVAEFGRVDVVFNNAGISPAEDGSILETSEELWDRIQDVNVKSIYLSCRASLKVMQEQGSGSIINVASFVALMGSATSQSAYTASKGAVLALTRELGVEFARVGIRVNSVCPGPVNTPLLQDLFAADPERAQRRFVHIPLGRFAEPEEIANAVLFLASDESSYVTASTFLVDGGITAAYVTPL